MRVVRTIAALLLAATAMLAVAAAPASATTSSTAVVVQASPNPVIAGHSVTLSGSVGPQGAATDCADLIRHPEDPYPVIKESGCSDCSGGRSEKQSKIQNRGSR